MRQIRAAVMELKRSIDERHVGAYAAQSAYFMFMSFLPLVLMLLSLVRFTGIPQEELYLLMENVIPAEFRAFIQNLLVEMYDRTAATISLSALVAAWSAGKSFMALNRGMNVICQVEKRSNYFLQRLRGSLFAVFFVALLVLTLLLVVFGSSIHELLVKYFPLLAVVTRILLAFRMALMLALFILFFTVLYITLPNRWGRFWEQLPGAIFTALGWYLFSFGFSIYVEYGHAFNMYGSLTTIILLMFWLYFVMYIILIGAAINEWLNGKRT